MKALRSLIASLLAMLILGGSAGLQVSQHFCQGQLWSAALFGNAGDCGMEAGDDVRPAGNGASVSEVPCCEEHLVDIRLEEPASLLKLQKLAQSDPGPILPVYPSSFLLPIPVREIGLYRPPDYQPPALDRDITLIIQSFLI